MPDAAFLQLGGGEVAYLKTVRSDEVLAAYPGYLDLAPGLTLWSLHSADGRPIMLTDSREAALANAVEAELVTVSVH
nr:DUF1150 domain-containing protein [Oryzibacter oryziterrae]